MSHSYALARLSTAAELTVQTAADLYALETYAGIYPASVRTLGAITVGDGAGVWRWDSASTETPTYDAAAGVVGTVIQLPGVAIGRYLLVFDDETTAAQWGCRTDRNNNDVPLNVAMAWLTPRKDVDSYDQAFDLVTALGEVKIINGESKTYPIADQVTWRDCVALKNIGMRATAAMSSMLATAHFHEGGYWSDPPDEWQTWWCNVIGYLHLQCDGYQMTCETNEEVSDRGEDRPITAILGVHSDWYQWDLVTVEGARGTTGTSPGGFVDSTGNSDVHLDAVGVLVRTGGHFADNARVFFAESYTNHIKAVRCRMGIFLRQADAEHNILTAQKCLDVGVNLRATNSWNHIHVYGGNPWTLAETNRSKYRGIGVLLRPGNSTGGRSITAETSEYGVVFDRGTYRGQDLHFVFYNNLRADLVVNETSLQGNFTINTGTRPNNALWQNGILCTNDYSLWGDGAADDARGKFLNAHLHLSDYDRSLDLVLENSKVDGAWTSAMIASDTFTETGGPDSYSKFTLANSEIDLRVTKWIANATYPDGWTGDKLFAGVYGDKFTVESAAESPGASYVRVAAVGFLDDPVRCEIGSSALPANDTKFVFDGRITPLFTNDGGKNEYHFYRAHSDVEIAGINFSGGSQVFGTQTPAAGSTQFRAEIKDIATRNGDGTTTSFGLTDSPVLAGAVYRVHVTALSADGAGPFWVDCPVGPSKPTIRYVTAPPAGTGNIVLAYHMQIVDYQAP